MPLTKIAMAANTKAIELSKEWGSPASVTCRPNASMFEEIVGDFSRAAHGSLSCIQSCSHRFYRSDHRRNGDGQRTNCTPYTCDHSVARGRLSVSTARQFPAPDRIRTV